MDAVTSYLTKKVLADIDNLSGNTMEKERSQIYYATPAFQNSTKDDLISGKLHLGVFALACSHHSLAQSVGLSFKDLDLLNKYNINSISSINSQQPNYWDKDVKIYTLISDWLSAMVNAHVDVAKDPYINRLNVRTFTLQATAMLLRAGKGESTFYFLAQPVLVEAAKEFEKNSGFYGAEKMSRLKLIKNLQDKYIREMEEAGFDPKDVSLAKNITFASLSDEDAAKMFDIDYLRKIMPRKNTAEWYINQIKVLKAFEELQPFAQALSELTTISQIDTKKYGNNFALQQAFLMKMADFFKKNASIINPASIIRNTFLKEKLRAALINPRNIFSNSLVRVTRDFEKHRAQLYSLTIGYGSENLTDSVANSITRIMESNYKLKAIAKYAKDNGVRAKELLYGDNSIPRRLVKIKRLIQSGVFPELLTSDGRFENALLDNIEPMFKTSPVDFVLPDFLTYKQNKTADGNMDDEVIRAWEELLDFDTDVEENKEAAKEIRKFARDLAIYAMYTSGDAFGKNNIFKFVPNSFRESSGYFDEIRQLEADQTNYYEQLDDNTLLRNLWWNDDIVPQLEAYTTSYDEMGVPERVMRDNIGSGQDINGVEIPGLFTATNIECPILYKNVNGQRVHRLYVKLSFGEKNDPRTTKLYKFVGLKKETVTKNGSSMEFTEPVYKLVTKKGLNFKGKTFIESIGSERTPSVIDINNETFDIDLPSLGIEPVVDYTPASFNNDRIDPINVINQFIFNTEKPSESVSPSASESATETPVQTVYVNHSGGAIGSDYYWGMIGEKYGVKSNHYWYKNITPNGNVEILEEDALEGQQKVTIAARQMGRIAPTHQVRDERLIRNWSQVKYSDAIFAVTTLLQVGDEMNYGKKALIVQGKGGTGYAIQMAINEGKPTYVYDQIRKRWYKNINGEWSETDTPTLTPNFAGIGTRELNEDGKRAIEEVYEKTFKFSQDFVDSETTVQPTLAEQWSQKEGWSVEYFNSRVLPRLNEAWQIEFELSPDQSVNVPRSRTATMNFDYNGQQKPDITATSTIEAIKNGERTATTRYESDGNIDSFWKQFKVGDYVKFEKRNSNREVIDSVIVVVTKPITKLRAVDSMQQSLQFDTMEETPITSSNRNTYTFGNGFTVELPFALNEQQIAALKELEDFVHNDKTSITLSGYAGTGKTTIMSIFHKYLKSLPYMVNGFYNEPLYLAPTHRAAAVVKKMNPEADTNTLHSFLGISGTIDLTSDKFDASTLEFDRTDFRTTQDKILIIDESSMISDDLYDFLQESVAQGHDKVIYIGDPAQLKPVSDRYISKVFRENPSRIKLTQVERTGDNAILNEATRLRNGEELTYNTSLNSRGEGIIFTNDTTEVRNYINRMLNSVEYQTDPSYFKILSGINRVVPAYNDMARKALYGADSEKVFVVGELLTAYDSERKQYFAGKSTYLIANSIDYRVMSVRDIKGKVLPGSTIKVDGYELTLRDLFRGGKDFKVFIIDPNTSQDVINDINNHIDRLWAQYKAFNDTRDGMSAKRTLSEIDAFRDSFSTIRPLFDTYGKLKKKKTFDYGYAQTIHKSQGGTYNNVLVIGGTIDSFAKDPLVQQQLKYVAVTRAKEQVMYTVPRSQEINTNVNIATTTGTPVNSELDKLGEQRKNECK